MYQQNDKTNTANSEVNSGLQELIIPKGPQQPTDDGTQNNPVSLIRDLVGHDVVLLPVIKGQKAPAENNWQDTDIVRMGSADYVARLQGGNIGVLLGSKSGGLCAIDIDSDEEVDPFLSLNPKLITTLRTKGRRGAQIWVRISGAFEKLKKLKTKEGEDWGEWRADGGQSVIYGVHPEGVDYQFLHQAKPVEVAFSDIQWPEDLKLPWQRTDAEIVAEEHGEPFAFSRGGGIIINQIYFVKKYMLEHRVKFDSNLRDYFQYDIVDGVWKRQSEESLKRHFLEDLGQAAHQTGIAELHVKRTDQTASSLLNLLRSMVEEQNVFQNRPEAIHVANGMIRFAEGQGSLVTFHPDFLSRNRCPYAYDPSAECPRFLGELLVPALNEEDISLLQRWAGSVLLGRNSAQRFLMLLGTAGGGKSTLMAILERIIGPENVAQMRTEHLSERFELFGYAGKSLLTGKDVSSDFLMHKGAHVLKALVGHDRLEAEKKGSNQRIQLVGDFNVGITCNADLNVLLQGDAGAWRRRMLVIRYENDPPAKRIPDFAEQLLSIEGAGILRWMVEGAIQLLANLRQRGDYILTTTQLERIDSLMNQSDSVRRFVREGVVANPGASITNEELLAAYYEFCDAQQWTPFSAKDARSELVKQMLAMHKASNRHDIVHGGKAVRGFKHVSLREGGVC